MTATIFATRHSRAARLYAGMIGVICLAGLLAGPPAHAAEDPEIKTRRQSEKRVFTDAEIIKGFFRIAFGAEFRVAGAIDRIRKFDRPVRVTVDNRGAPDRSAAVAEVVADINARVQNLDIAMAAKPEDANVTVTLVRERDLKRTLRKFYGNERARQIQKSLDPQCLSGFQKDEKFRIVRADVILVVDSGEFIFRDCIYEELLQALGPINDTDAVPWTMFNDDVQMGFFGVYDQYILNILYHRHIRPGMTVDEVSGLLPQIIPQVRSFVERNNKIAP